MCINPTPFLNDARFRGDDVHVHACARTLVQGLDAADP